MKGLCELVRYADDFVCLVRYAVDVENVEQALRRRLEKLGHGSMLESSAGVPPASLNTNRLEACSTF